MSLTVPRAGLTAGRAAQPQIEASRTGEAMARFGDVMMQVGTRIETDRLDREMGRLQVDMTRDLNNLRLEFEQMGDPDAIDTIWPQRVAELRTAYLDGQDENGRRRVDPKNADRFSLGFDDLANRHAFAVGRNSLALRQSERIATWGDYRATAAPQAATTDANTREALYATFDARTDALVADGTMTPEQAAIEKRGFRIETENARIIGMVSDDPTGFLAAADAGEFSDLPPETIARYRVQAQNGIARAEKEIETEARLAEKERNTAIGKRLGDIASIAGKDRVAVDEIWLSDPEVQAHEDYPKAKAALDLRDERGDFRRMTVTDLDALIAEEQARPVTEPFQTERLQVLQEQREASAAGWARDQIAFATKNGFKVPELPAFDAANPDAFRDGLEKRVAFSGALREAGYIERMMPLSLDEQAAIRTAASEENSPADRARLAHILTETVGRRAPDALSGLLHDQPEFRFAGGLLAAGGNDALAQEILRGQEAMKRDNVNMPPVKDRRAPVYDRLMPLFSALPSTGQKRMEELVAAADAVYASRYGFAADGAVDEDQYLQIMHEVSGGTGIFNSGGATGGINTVNGGLTFMPMGLSADRFETAYTAFSEAVSDRNQQLFGQEGPKDERWRATDAIITGASATGRLPAVNGVYLAPSDWTRANVVAVGDDRYELIVRVNGVPVAAEDPVTGDRFRFSLRKFVSGVEQNKGALHVEPAVEEHFPNPMRDLETNPITNPLSRDGR